MRSLLKKIICWNPSAHSCHPYYDVAACSSRRFNKILIIASQNLFFFKTSITGSTLYFPIRCPVDCFHSRRAHILPQCFSFWFSVYIDKVVGCCYLLVLSFIKLFNTPPPLSFDFHTRPDHVFQSITHASYICEDIGFSAVQATRSSPLSICLYTLIISNSSIAYKR